ncbi:MAG: hypothetical protein ACP5PN_03480 [Steroidobacteraceae bacterium]
MQEPRTERLIAEFVGAVACARETGASPGVTLRGASAGEPPEGLIVSFVAADGAQLPTTLEGARVVAVDASGYRIESPPQHWLLRARTVFVHRDVRAAFFRAIPPRPAPPGKRLFWRAVLRLARSRAGLRLLAALRGR